MTLDKCNSGVYVQFVRDGASLGPPILHELNTTRHELGTTCCNLIGEDVSRPYSLFVGEEEILERLQDVLKATPGENVITVRYERLAQFRVSAVTRTIGELSGHAEAVVCASFSPDGKYLATGSGDTTVRLWDVGGVFSLRVCNGHKDWVLCVVWSPDAKKLASACKKGVIYVWDPVTASPLRRLVGHTKWITSISWQPFQSNSACRLLMSGSKDYTIRIWDTNNSSCLMTLCGHTMSVTAVRWGSAGYLYSASQDKSIRVWKEDGSLVHSLTSHAHWVNCIVLSTDSALLKGPFSGTPHKDVEFDLEEKVKLAESTLKMLKKLYGERIVSGSDDKTAILWHPELHLNPLQVMRGHQQSINHIVYSPDARYIATASFDHSIRLWDGPTGKYLATLRGHLQAVYQICWSPDGQFLASCSADSTVKVWQIPSGRLEMDLPGHADEVYTIDWSPCGTYVATAGKDCVVKIWHR